MPAVCTVIPNWNGADFLSECLESLRAQDLPADVRHTIVVVENGSVDASRELLARDFPDVDVVLLPENLGFAGGVNRGIARARELGADFVALLNNDAVADPRWLASLLAAAEPVEPSAQPAMAGSSSGRPVGIVAAKSVHIDDGTIDTAGDCYSIYGIAFPRGRNVEDTGQFDLPAEVFAASGGSSLYRMAMLDEIAAGGIGDFPEEFFAYWEDVDVSFRARLAGWRIVYTPNARVRHGVNRTSAKLGGFVRYHTFKNCLLLWLRCMPTPLALRYLPHFLFALVWQLTSDATRGRLPDDLRALGVVVRLLPRTLRQRRRIQRSRQVPVEEIDALLHHSWPATMRSPRDRLRSLGGRLRALRRLLPGGR